MKTSFTTYQTYNGYELSDHLGNVRVVLTDRRVSTYNSGFLTSVSTDISSWSDYFSFGWEIPGRTFTSENYRYGFNGMEKDDEVKTNGNSYDFGARMYDPRVGRWMGVDPMAGSYPEYSPYNFALNVPTKLIDPDGGHVTITRICEGGENGKDLIIIKITGKVVNKTTLKQKIESQKAYIQGLSPRRKRKIEREKERLLHLEQKYEDFRNNIVKIIKTQLEETYSGQGESIDWKIETELTYSEDGSDIKESDHVFYAVDNVIGAIARANMLGGKALYFSPTENTTSKFITFSHELGHLFTLLHPGENALKQLEKGKPQSIYINWMSKHYNKNNFMSIPAGPLGSPIDPRALEHQILFVEKMYLMEKLNREGNEFDVNQGSTLKNQDGDDFSYDPTEFKIEKKQ